MRIVFIALIVLGSSMLAGVSQAQPPRIVLSATGAAKGARCIDDMHLKSKNGKVIECKYDCFALKGGAVCREYACEYVVCNESTGSYCSSPTGPNPGMLTTHTSAGICDPTGEKADIPGMCYYPEVVIDCGSAEACVEPGPGLGYCQYIPPKKDRR